MSSKYYFNYFAIFCGICVVSLSGWCSSYFINDPHGLGQVLALMFGGPPMAWGIYLIYSGVKKKNDPEGEEPRMDE